MKKGIEIYCSLIILMAAQMSMVMCECPDDSMLAPCSCDDDEHIHCDGDKPINICEMFKNLAKKLQDKKEKKDYEMFILSNTAVEEIQENCFDDIYFREIRIQSAVNLKRIHSNAFTGTDQLIERFLFINSPQFDPKNIFEILNKFKKLDAISLGDIGLKEIPSNAFQPHEALVWLWLNGMTIEKIGEKAFSSLEGLTEIHITNTSITEIPKDVFVFGKSEIPIEICLYNNPKMVVLNEQAFTHTGRPTDLDFSGDRFSDTIYSKQMPVLEAKVFQAFFAANELNKIEMGGQDFDCNECKNAWIKADPKILERVVNIKCADGKPIAQSFANCK